MTPTNSRYTALTLTELEADREAGKGDLAAINAAIAAKRAMETLLAIDGELYPPPSTILEGEA